MKKLTGLLMISILIFVGCSSIAKLTMDDFGDTHIGRAVLKEPARDEVKDIYNDTGIIKTNEYRPFTKKMEVYGITFVAKNNITDEFMMKVAKAMKEMFPKTESIDKKLQEQVLQNLYRYNALIPIVKSESDMPMTSDKNNEYYKIQKENSICDIIMEGSESQALEVIEHILHTVSDVGLHYTLTDEWGLTRNSKVYKNMQNAINKKFYNISGYSEVPKGEIKDRILIQEYAYWVITSGWNIQERYGLGEEEWKLKNKGMLKESLPSGYDLYENTIPKIMTAPSKEMLDSLELMKGSGKV